MSFRTLILGCVSVVAVACAAGSDPSIGSTNDEVVLDVRCESDADCPSGFECEIEEEHGVEQSYCKSHDGHDGDGDCPPGYELEEEHGGTFCKPHGGDDDAEDSSPTDDSGDDGLDDNGGENEGPDDNGGV